MSIVAMVVGSGAGAVFVVLLEALEEFCESEDEASEFVAASFAVSDDDVVSVFEAEVEDEVDEPCGAGRNSPNSTMHPTIPNASTPAPPTSKSVRLLRSFACPIFYLAALSV